MESLRVDRASGPRILVIGPRQAFQPEAFNQLSSNHCPDDCDNETNPKENCSNSHASLLLRNGDIPERHIAPSELLYNWRFTHGFTHPWLQHVTPFGVKVSAIRLSPCG